MDDLQRPPTDSDRAQVVARINKAHDAGQIATVDRDIRLGNVKTAHSMADLDLISRDLDQLQAALPATGAPGTGALTSAPAAAPYSTFDPTAARHSVDMTASGGTRKVAAVIAVVVAVVLLVGAVAAVIGTRSGTSSGGSSSASAPAPAPGQGKPGDPDVAPTGPKYSLTATGIKDFLSAYRHKFGTSRVVDLTLYGDYAIVDVPVPGKARQSGWLYRNDVGWRDFGGVRATFPGSAIVDTNRLAIPALMRNVTRARRTLNVELPAQTYVILRFIPQVDQVPGVDIHLSNSFQESGYLATSLDGKVLRRYPYTR